MNRLFILTILLHPFIALSLPEESLPDRYNDLINFFEKGSLGFLETPDKVKLAYRHFPKDNPSTTLVIFPGRTESQYKYMEFIYDLQNQPYEIFIFDWRGQGLSDRLLEDPLKGHITDFSTYRQDAELFLDKVVIPEKKGRQLVALAHSMGGNAFALLASKRPNTFDKIILSSPMLDLPTPGPQGFAWLYLLVREAMGDGTEYIPGHHPGTKIFSKNNVSNSSIRFDLMQRLTKEKPELLVKGATVSWARASIDAVWSMRKQAAAIKAPVLLLQAGDDVIVRTEGQNYVCAQVTSCRKEFFPKGKHELLQEVDEIRDRAIAAIVNFIGDP
ncbi:alpha/beta fold hydrolase [Pseudobacteriovorax antillogorgiicola]|uniref:Lysophospholipase n=1 Tax=Pseudobacteriovorax antillogorgiicola TaxID=1513793 RepID=A0A1Y6BTK4_9BACT|nr:alpha/beta hydrolase [Pseudobacteriovorax antillogorgiicola]TCS52977.1 lysophospholipase [Pseudobacteriovorax antillogorgiicola]SMF27386.1 lysophospholipase [Pseudobacteriovorax antillogorgiicola]